MNMGEKTPCTSGFLPHSAKGGNTNGEGSPPVVLTDEFRRIWEAANQSYLSWSDLDGFPLPQGASKQYVWKLVTTLRRHAGFALPFRPYVHTSDGESAWIAPTHDMERALALLKTQGNSQTVEYQTFAALPLSRKAAIMMDDIGAALTIDGYHVDASEGLSAYLARIPPQTPERVAMFSLIEQFLEPIVAAPDPITPVYLDSLNGLISAAPPSVGLGASQPVLAHIEQHRSRYLNLDYYTPETVKHTICDILNDTALHPIVAELQARYFLIALTPYATGNAATSLLLRKTFLEKHNLGLLAHACTLTAITAWQQGSYDLNLPSYDAALSPHDCGEGFDATEFTHYNLLVFANELRQIRIKVARTEANLASVRERIAGAPFLNARQKLLVSQMAEDPFHATTIEQFAQKHDVSYSSARTDLIGLTQQGYAVCDRPESANEALTYRTGPKTLALFRRDA